MWSHSFAARPPTGLLLLPEARSWFARWRCCHQRHQLSLPLQSRTTQHSCTFLTLPATPLQINTNLLQRLRSSVFERLICQASKGCSRLHVGQQGRDSRLRTRPVHATRRRTSPLPASLTT